MPNSSSVTTFTRWWHPVLICMALAYCGIADLRGVESTPQLQRFYRTEKHMGSDFTVKLYTTSAESAEEMFGEAFGIIAQYDRTMSDYNRESELSQLGVKSNAETPVVVSEPLWNVLNLSAELSDKTAGVFDVTVGPLTKLWRRARRQRELPTLQERTEALAAVGWRNVQLDSVDRSVRLLQPGMRIDLGGIAPGYAADMAMVKVQSMGAKGALVDASGDVSVGEPPPGEPGWKIGIAPLQVDAPPDRYVLLANQAISTSGDAFRGVEIGGVRYSHIVDSRTGMGVKHRSSVTVIAASGATADGLATALSVAGPAEGMKLLQNFPAAEARFVTQDAQGTVHESQSPGFAKYVQPLIDPSQTNSAEE